MLTPAVEVLQVVRAQVEMLERRGRMGIARDAVLVVEAEHRIQVAQEAPVARGEQQVAEVAAAGRVRQSAARVALVVEAKSEYIAGKG